MHGVVNQAIEGLITKRFGPEAWEDIRIASQCSDTTFYNNHNYSDSVTYELVVNASKTLDIDIEILLFEFGKYWVLTIAAEKYAALLHSAGKGLREFLVNLPNFHSRVMLYYPEITPPEFKVMENSDTSLELQYFSKRPGLQPFVHGILEGLSTFFETPITIDLKETKLEDEYNKSIFLLHF
ncbi:heme NO-binding domain-containing protein [Flavobacterium sp.]|jgi:hypothetical protein|uniref:heme NO-binding domain-containing protein n=1 Tax=Flavobacterium sp. TaxID=239 RepID=UPI00334021B3